MGTKEVPGLDLEQFFSDWQPETQGENDFTVKQLAKEYRITPVSAYEMVSEMEDSGKVEKIHGIQASGRRGNFYRIIQS